jgi:hypothetical protein
MLVEVLTFDGCPHATEALKLVQRVAAATHRTVEVRLVDLVQGETAARRFLGSPSIRVEGRDIEPAADARRNYAFSCRLYSTPSGLRPLPPEAWVRDALDAAESSIST